MSDMPIGPGTHVTLELIARDKTRERLELVLVDDAAADFGKGLLGLGTPLAQALMGHMPGETLPYQRGDIVQVRVLAVRESNVPAGNEAAAQRDESLRRARDKAELANMVSFALTFDSKWGDYDPEQIVANYEARDEGAPKPDPRKDDAPPEASKRAAGEDEPSPDATKDKA